MRYEDRFNLLEKWRKKRCAVGHSIGPVPGGGDVEEPACEGQRLAAARREVLRQVLVGRLEVPAPHALEARLVEVEVLIGGHGARGAPP